MPTQRHRQVAKLLLENTGMTLAEAMRRVKYRPAYIKNSGDLLNTKGMQELIGIVYDPSRLMEKHNQLLNASKIEHMVFPLAMTDEDIKSLLAKNNCTVQRFMHSETQTHVWYFTADNMAQIKIIQEAHKIRGDYAPEKLNLSGSLSLADLFERAEEKRKQEARKAVIIKPKKSNAKKAKRKVKKA